MTKAEMDMQPPWAGWKKIIFRFFFIYLIFRVGPWVWIEDIPVLGYLPRQMDKGFEWLVHLCNDKLFHVRAVLIPQNGSGDTSYGWAELWFFIMLAVVVCIIWSVLDRKRSNYTWLNYWLCLFTRYYIAGVAFGYGIIKIFCLQMVFPSLHQLATPLGDFLPMRFSWLFIGYSTSYQVFSGMMEVVAALLLLYRRTTTLGTLVATGVFLNVMMLNLSYDIPVKIYSTQLFISCLYLLANETPRFINFFVLNQPAGVSAVYNFSYSKKWMRISRVVLKIAFIGLTMGMVFYDTYTRYKGVNKAAAKTAFKNGIYEVTDYSIGKRNTPLAFTDTLRWQDVVLENGTGSIRTGDTTFKQRYYRAYFVYTADTIKHTMAFKRKMPNDSLIALINMQYTMPDSNTINLWGVRGNDSLFVVLKKSKHHFQLAERQFHWLSEHNR